MDPTHIKARSGDIIGILTTYVEETEKPWVIIRYRFLTYDGQLHLLAIPNGDFVGYSPEEVIVDFVMNHLGSDVYCPEDVVRKYDLIEKGIVEPGRFTIPEFINSEFCLVRRGT